MVQFEEKLQKFDFNHWQVHIPVADEFANQMMDKNHRRVLVWINDSEAYHMALMKAKAYWYILVNQDIRKKLRIDVGDQVSVKLERDHSEYGHELPEEFQVLMDQDEEGAAYFKALTPGHQRGLVYIITKVKSPESRMKKALAIMHHLKLAKGVLDYKQLNELIKYYNNL